MGHVSVGTCIRVWGMSAGANMGWNSNYKCQEWNETEVGVETLSLFPWFFPPPPSSVLCLATECPSFTARRRPWTGPGHSVRQSASPMLALQNNMFIRATAVYDDLSVKLNARCSENRGSDPGAKESCSNQVCLSPSVLRHVTRRLRVILECSHERGREWMSGLPLSS